MVEWNIPVPDDLDSRVRSYLDKHGSELVDFVSRAVSEQLAYEDDIAFQAEITNRIKCGMADVDAGRVRDASEAMNEIAATHKLNLLG
jgi:predicted transcriptional regulator